MNDEHKECLICKSKKIKPLDGTYSNHGLVKCKNCDFVFMNRIPSEEELHDHYNTYAYASEGYLSPLTEASYENLLDEFEKYRTTNRILDIGTGRGWFLDCAKKRGWQVFGTEFSPTAVEQIKARGIEIHHGEIRSGLFDGIDFDVITSFEVIEHINNPLKEIPIIYGMLRENGLFYCTTPNFNSILRFYFKGDFDIINYPEHLSYYTRKTINNLLTSNGLKKNKLLTTGISISRFKSSSGTSHEHTSEKGSSDEKLRKQLASNSTLKLVKILADKLLSITGLGMTIKAYYIKP